MVSERYINQWSELVIFMITKRQIKILEILSKEKVEISGKEIAAFLSVSSRTIRQDIKEINQENTECIKANKKGYYLAQQASGMVNWTDKENSALDHSSVTLLYDLLINKKALSIDDLSEEYYMSTSSAVIWIGRINDYLNKYYLTLRSNANRLYIDGSEYNKRSVISSIVVNEADSVIDRSDVLHANLITLVDMDGLKKIVNETVHKYKLFIDDYQIKSFILNLSIVVSRIKMGNAIDKQDVFGFDCRQLNDLSMIVSELVEKTEKLEKIIITETETEYIKMLLMGVLKPRFLHEYLAQISTMYNEDVFSSIHNIVYKVFSYYMLNVNYEDWIPSFAVHVVAMINRCKLRIGISDDIKSNIKIICPFVYEVAVTLANEIGEKYEIDIPDNEISFIAVHIGYVIENNAHYNNSVNLTVYASEYHNINNKLIEYLGEQYPECQINVYDQEKNPHIHNNDLLITTNEMHVSSQDIVFISPFLRQIDKQRIEESIRIKKDRLNKCSVSNALMQCFRKELFFKNIKFSQKSECISFLADQLIKYGVVPSHYTNGVLKREELSSTAYFDAFAIPHSIEMNAYKTTIAVLVCSEPMAWDDSKVHIVFMLAIEKKEREEFMKIYNGVIDSLCDYKKIDKILNAKDYIDFLNIMIENTKY
ncbi:MAG: PRD domain-containing protein [Erysipelotrichia bacterium]|nr:PRD domain-containing protein [Erysipelotrichia bacterium]